MATKKSARISSKRKTNRRSSVGASVGTSGRSDGGATNTQSGQSVMGMPLKTWIGSARRPKGADLRAGKRGFILVFGEGRLEAESAAKGRGRKSIRAAIEESSKKHLSKWQMEMCHSSKAEAQHFHGQQGPVWIVSASGQSVAGQSVSGQSVSGQSAGGGENNRARELDKPSYARYRDLAGSIVPQLDVFALEKLIVEFNGLTPEEERGFFVGLEMAAYSFAGNTDNPRRKRKKRPQILVSKASDQVASEIEAAARLALSVNLARHLVNLPGGTLHPRNFSEIASHLFTHRDSTSVEIWSGEKLIEERMNLLLAVGGGAVEGPRLVHLRYRPPNAQEGLRPVAIVGKGITFDSGGLDIKPSSGMRLMKKDMGGAAAALAILHWADSVELPVPLDVYLSLAENAVSAASFRPGDILTARNGLAIEIHNTDAEGRLVLADALDVAVSQEDPTHRPAAVINLATLTGAIKVGLGAEIAGMFCNDDDLALELFDAGSSRGDFSWRMPLYQPYKSMLRSTFADHVNASDGFAGAITAALFLELFVKDIPWAHFDIYAWKDSAGGAWAEAGGSGQPVQAVTEFLERLSKGSMRESFG